MFYCTFDFSKTITTWFQLNVYSLHSTMPWLLPHSITHMRNESNILQSIESDYTRCVCDKRQRTISLSDGVKNMATTCIHEELTWQRTAANPIHQKLAKHRCGNGTSICVCLEYAGAGSKREIEKPWIVKWYYFCVRMNGGGDDLINQMEGQCQCCNRVVLLEPRFSHLFFM